MFSMVVARVSVKIKSEKCSAFMKGETLGINLSRMVFYRCQIAIRLQSGFLEPISVVALRAKNMLYFRKPIQKAKNAR